MWHHVHRSIPLDMCSQNINIKTVVYCNYLKCPTHAQPAQWVILGYTRRLYGVLGVNQLHL